ncbi:MAG: hypothetical protein K9J37_13610 [Saprospiraceae bacterium]|nr:hypothetical protein [Saprospiraceae bacterium]MCF8250946.1 hypothetical protein [Saprospiraceae bacterium]MCF8281923.1 hypothetical protein [Bacteroidales bacterium]MCF8311910.1 hypothetical protein [Saprospiraceae bacterium]MCF8441918.1 hypothetical protein [Saprospiraceae bacterium]
MRSSKKQVLKAIDHCFSIVQTEAAKSENNQFLETGAALQTMRRIFKSMSDRAYLTHLEGYDEDHSLPRLLRVSSSVLLLFFCSAMGAQPLPAPPGFYNNPVPYNTVSAFHNARCHFTDTDTFTISLGNNSSYFPTSYRTDLPSKIFTAADRAVPFGIYYQESTTSQLYLIAKGYCRNISTLVPLPRPGWYFVRYFHQAKPALVVINARHQTLKITINGACEIHE